MVHFFSSSPKYFKKQFNSKCNNVVFTYRQQHYLSRPAGIWWLEFNTHIFLLIPYQNVAPKREKIYPILGP